ncbi:Uncharacterised protein [Bordetella pertussis]|nr:Uncharacterised protein [Bordetella pertussis]
MPQHGGAASRLRARPGPGEPIETYTLQRIPLVSRSSPCACRFCRAA